MVSRKTPSHTGHFSLSIRDTVLETDGHKCRSCGAMENLETDHIRPLNQGGEHTFENVQTLCRGCHLRKTYYEERIKTKHASSLLGPLPPEATGPHYYVATGVWNATKNRWEQFGPFLSYDDAWEWVESEWLSRPRTR